MTRWLRIARLALHVARGLVIAALFFPSQSKAERNREIQRWARGLLKIVAITRHVHGEIGRARPLMLIGNHVSWLDIFAVQSVMPVRFVAKTETRAWPLLGWLSEKAGTLFIEQSRRRDTHRINREVADALRAGDVFAIFPEGTTTDGSRLLKFHASLLAPALEVDAAVQPFAIRYERIDGTLCTSAAFDGERSLWETVLGMTREPRIDLHVTFLEPLATRGSHRRDIASDARSSISRTLGLEDASSRSGTDADPPDATP